MSFSILDKKASHHSDSYCLKSPLNIDVDLVQRGEKGQQTCVSVIHSDKP